MHRQSRLALLALTATLAATATACGDSAPARLTAEQLRDPTACQGCHPKQFAAWSKSMHAYAADDPVFLAMNQRGQRETGGALGTFCVKCHAPLAVREGLTTDGLNLATVPSAKKGVTCFFCHSAESVDGTHDNPLVLTTDGRMLGPIADPDPSAPHGSGYAATLDDGKTESATTCGSCHDIVNGHGVALERTFQEWQQTLFAVPPHGLSCASCHMNGSDDKAAVTSKRIRRLHDHAFPAVDVTLTVTPTPAELDHRRAVQDQLDSAVQGTICFNDGTQSITVAVDNVGAGHSFPSGASQDRRLWLDVTAYAGAQVLYQSGVKATETVETAADPDLVVLRDCIFDGAGNEVRMFWEAQDQTINLLPGPVVATAQDPTSFNRTHVKYAFPRTGPLSASPDRIRLQMYLKPVGDDVLQSLVASGDLDPAVAALVPTFAIGGGGTLEWTRAGATASIDATTGDRLLCVAAGAYTPVSMIATGGSHAHCVAPARTTTP
jgi:hypothetical protein